MAQLANKVAIITGAAKGMGASHARVFAERGAKVVLTDVDAEAGQQLADEIGADAIFVKQDVSKAGDWDKVVTEANKAFGPVTVLVNNAGVSGPVVYTAELSEEDFKTVSDINILGVFLGMKAVIPGMIDAGGGSIVNISSIGGFTRPSFATNTAYIGAKFAVRGMSKSVAVEYGPNKIRANSVHPGAVLTPMLDEMMSDEAKQTIIDAIPLGNMASPLEASEAVAFLASDASSHMTGGELLLDGGMLAL